MTTPGDEHREWTCRRANRPRHAAHEINSLKAKAMVSAAHILATRGLEELNLRAIAENAGIGIASMYHYFSSKEEILLNLGLAGFDELRREMLRMQPNPAFLSPIGASAAAFFNFAETRSELFALMFNPRMLARHDALREAEQKAFKAHETVVFADPRIDEAHRESAAYALWALGRGMAAIMSSQPSGRLSPELAARLMDGARYLIAHER